MEELELEKEELRLEIEALEERIAPAQDTAEVEV